MRSALLGAAVMTVAPASIASATELTIYPGVGIGKVRLGMTAAQVTRALGRDFLVTKQSNLSGSHYVEYGWDYSHWTVTFQQRGAKLRAVQVALDLPSQKTAKGIGVGTRWHKLVSSYPGGRCGWGNHYSPIGGYLEYLVGHRGGTQTLYTLNTIAKRLPGQPHEVVVDYKIIEVRVRSPFEQLEEFGPKRISRCSDDWPTTNAPQHLPAR